MGEDYFDELMKRFFGFDPKKVVEKGWVVTESNRRPLTNIDVENLLVSILFKLKNLRRRAMKFGSAIGIGHPHPETADAIRRFLDSAFSKDLSLVHASQIVHA